MDIDKYFAPVPRAKVKFQESVNYSTTSLLTSLKTDSAKELLRIITHETVTNRYPLIESHAGFGSASIIFAQQVGAAIRELLLIENNTTLRQMLERNLGVYGYLGNPAIRVSADFDKIPRDFEGGVGVFLPLINFTEPIPIPVITNEEEAINFLGEWWNKDIFIGSQKLDSLLFLMNKSRNLQLALFIVPAGFPLGVLDGYTITAQPYLNYQIFIAKSEAGKTIALGKGWGLKINEEQESQIKIMAMVKKILNEINHAPNVLAMKPQPVPIDVDLYTSEKWVPTWVRALTHSSYNEKDNYESLEHQGDRILKGSWAEMMKKYYPDVTPKEGTTSENRYMSERGQPQLTVKMGLDKVARYVVNSEFRMVKLQEDLFESFAGALAEISNEEEGDATGAFRVSQYLYYNFPKPPSRSDFQPLGSQVKQALEALWWSWDKPKPTKHGGVWQMSIRIPESMDQFLKLHNVIIPNRILGEAQGTNEKVVKDIMYENALETLKKYGLTEDVTKRMADEYRINIEAYQDYNRIEQQMKIRKARILYTFPYKDMVNGKYTEVVGLWEVENQGPNTSNTSNKRTRVIQIVGDWKSQKELLQTQLLAAYLKIK